MLKKRKSSRFTVRKKHTRPRTKAGPYDEIRVKGVDTTRDGIKVVGGSDGRTTLTSPGRDLTEDHVCKIPIPLPKEKRFTCLSVKVESLPEEGGVVAIGLGVPRTFREQPGWSVGTLGFHSDDGCLHFDGEKSRFLGRFGEGDEIKMSFNNVDDKVYIVKNGKRIGDTLYRYTDMFGHPMFWMIGMDKSGTVVSFDQFSCVCLSL